MGSKQIPAEKPNIVEALMKIATRLESLTNQQWDEMIYLKTSSIVEAIKDALRGNYEISFGDIIRELKCSLPGFGEDIRKKYVELLQMAASVDKKKEAGEPPIKSDLKLLRSGIQQLVDDIRFVAKKLHGGG